MLFIDALSRVGPQQNAAKQKNRLKNRSNKASRDSVDLSMAAHEVKEIHLDSQEKAQLTAASSIFANLMEHILSYVLEKNLTILSPEELNIAQKDWQFSLQSPPSSPPQNSQANYGSSYQEPEVRKPIQQKQLRFTVPVKPVYGNTIDMTVFLSAHQGSPQIPKFFSALPKESKLPMLRTPYSPEFIEQQSSYYHVFFDQDGEPDQLAPLYPLLEPPPSDTLNGIEDIYGLRLWRAQGNRITPVVLGDNKIGLLYVGHFRPLIGSADTFRNSTKKSNYLYTKA